MFEQTFKNIDDILYKDAGADSELDYTEQSSWILFLRYLDDLELEKKDEAELSNEEIDNEINSCKENPIDLEVYLEELFPQLNESGRETIVKLAYWVSISDGHFDKEEEKLLKKLAKHFQISDAHLKGIILEVDETISG